MRKIFVKSVLRRICVKFFCHSLSYDWLFPIGDELLSAPRGATKMKKKHGMRPDEHMHFPLVFHKPLSSAYFKNVQPLSFSFASFL